MKKTYPSSKQFKALRKRAESLLAIRPTSAAFEKQDIYELLHELNVHQIELEMQNEELSHAQIELEESRNQYVDLYDFAPISYLTLDKDYMILAVNFAGSELLGMERLRLQKRNFLNFIPEAFRTKFIQYMEQLFTTKIKQICELELIKKDGNRCYVKMESIISYNNQIRIAIMDITADKQLELMLLEANKKLRLVDNLFQSATDAIAALDTEFKIISFNRAFKEVFNKLFKIEVTTNLNLINIFSDFSAQQQEIINACQQALLDKESVLTYEGRDIDSSYYCFEAKFSRIMDVHSQCIGLTYFIRNITQYKLNEHRNYRRQAEIAYVSRMNTMGEMASALAHEINQPLAAIDAYSQGCLVKMEQGIVEAQKFLQSLQKIALQSQHAGAIIHRMKSFMREGKMYYETVDINELITEACDLINYELSDTKIKLKLELTPILPHLRVDRVQIGQVLLNLLCNSIEAVQNTNILQPEIIIRTCIRHEMVEVQVIDNGPGISEDVADKILNSYFTTKSQGTGLGLAICRTLIEAHGGKLMVKKKHKGGACFQFTLPIVHAEIYADT